MSIILVPPPSVGGAFDLIDQDRRPFSDRELLGRYAVIFFGFTHCKVVCPKALQRLSDALEHLGDRAASIQGLYITVDPERDTPARLRDFLSPWPRFQGLTGSLEQVAKVRAAFRIFAERRDTIDGYDVPHSAVAHLIDPAGRHIDHWQADLSADQIVKRMSGRLRGEAREVVRRNRD
jgi:protein SCO1/2